MRILISGGGIAGLTLAYWLHRYGHTPVVVERAPHGRLGGYGIDFFGTGYDVAARMGIADRLAAHQLPTESIRYVDGAGRVAARLDRRLLEKVIRGPYLALMHTTLEEALGDAVHDQADIRYGRSITAIEQSPGGVGVTFTDGECERASTWSWARTGCTRRPGSSPSGRKATSPTTWATPWPATRCPTPTGSGRTASTTASPADRPSSIPVTFPGS